MPLLKDLMCSIELSESQQSLQEFGTVYGDGIVETFVPVPRRPQTFSVHLTSTKFIAPGLSIFVFVDGVYQCNRNRRGLEVRSGSDSRSLVDFRVRQKEERQKDGSMIARPWNFDGLDTASADKAPSSCSPNLLENTGCIEVVVLRCIGSRTPKNITNSSLDGAADYFDGQSGWEGRPRNSEWHSTHHREPSNSEFGSHYGPPPPVPSYHGPFAQPFPNIDDTASTHRGFRARRGPSPPAVLSHHSRAHSRCSESISPHAVSSNHVPHTGFEYGSGPVPAMAPRFTHYVPNAMPMNNVGVDPSQLGEILQDAVKKGIEEYRRTKSPPAAQSEHNEYSDDLKSQLPGAWPSPPRGSPLQIHQTPTVHNLHANDAQGISLGPTNDNTEKLDTKSRKQSRVTWNEDPVWESEDNAKGWSSPKKMADDSWDSDETWGTEKLSDIEVEKHRRHRKTSSARVRASSPTMPQSHNGHRSSSKKSHRASSKSRSRKSAWEAKAKSSSEDSNGWTCIDTPSESTTTQESSDSDTSTPRAKEQQHICVPPTPSGKLPKFPLYGHPYVPAYHPAPTYVEPAPPLIPQIIPRVMNAPSSTASVFFSKKNSRKPSVHTEPVAPPVFSMPNWGWPEPTETKKSSPLPSAPSAPSAPYAANENTFFRSKANEDELKDFLASSSAWGGDGKEETGWVEVDKSGWKDANDDEWKTIKPDNTQWNREEKTKDREANKETNVQWGPNDTYTISAGAPEKHAQGTSTSKRHTSKSLSKYRQLSQNPAPLVPNSSFVPNPQWQFPPAPTLPPKNPARHRVVDGSKRRNAIADLKESLRTTPKEIVHQKRLENQVTTGKEMRYGHAIGRPQYLDALDKPYAVFRFKYRSRAKLQSLFGADAVPDHGHLTVPTPASNMAKEKEKLEDLPQNELIEKMLKLQMKLAKEEQKKSPAVRKREASGHREHREEEKREEKQRKLSGASQQTEQVARNLTEKWVKQHSRDPSKKSASQGDAEKKKKERKAKTEEKPAWDAGWGGGGTVDAKW